MVGARDSAGCYRHKHMQPSPRSSPGVRRALVTRSVSTPPATVPLSLDLATTPVAAAELSLLRPDPRDNRRGIQARRRRHLRSVQRTGSSPVALSVVGRDGVHHSVQLGQQEVEELAARSATGVILLEPSLGPAGTAGTGGFAHLNHASKAAALAEENRQLRGALQRSRSQPSASAVLRRFRPSTCVHCGVVCLGCAPANNSS